MVRSRVWKHCNDPILTVVLVKMEMEVRLERLLALQADQRIIMYMLVIHVEGLDGM